MKMKVKQILEIIKVISGKRLPYDMEELDQQFYTSESQNKDYTIDEMDIIHLIRSFIKIYTYDKGLEQSVSQTNQIFKLEERVSELLEENQRLVKSKIKLKEKLAESVSADVYEMLFDKCERLQERIEELIPKKASPYYTFYEIPNDCEGQEFMDNLKKYLN